MRDHKQSELGVLGLLFIAVFLISEVLFNYFIYGFLGNGAFGPWSLVACPVLILLVVDVLGHPLGIYTSMKKQADILRMIAKRRLLSSQNKEHSVAIGEIVSDNVLFTTDKKLSPLSAIHDLWVEDRHRKEQTQDSTANDIPANSGDITDKHEEAMKILVSLCSLLSYPSSYFFLSLSSTFSFFVCFRPERISVRLRTSSDGPYLDEIRGKRRGFHYCR